MFSIDASRLDGEHHKQPTVADVTLTYIKTVSERIDRAETDFVDNLKRVEQRLDQIVGLMRDVASLQQQYTAQGEALGELRGAFREQTRRMESSITRVHTRLDELTTAMTTNIDLETTKISQKLDGYERSHKELDQNFHTWLNRGLGGWAMFILVVGALQFVGIRWLDNLEGERRVAADRLVKLTSRVADLENRLLQLDGAQATLPRRGP